MKNMLWRYAAVLSMLGAFAVASPITFPTGVQVVALEDGSIRYTEVGGATAIAGSAVIWYSKLATGEPTSSDTQNLQVGSYLMARDSQLLSGSAVYSGIAQAMNFTVSDGKLLSGSTDVDFDTLSAMAYDASAKIGVMDPNGYVDFSNGILTLKASDDSLNIFSVDAEILSSVSAMYLNAPAGSTIVINVLGESGAISGMDFFWNVFTSGDNTAVASNLLWNMPNISDFTIIGSTLAGSILAPAATLNIDDSNLAGQILAGNLYIQHSTLGDYTFTPQKSTSFSAPLPNPGTSEVPEPGTMLLFGMGFLLISVQVARNKRTPAISKALA